MPLAGQFDPALCLGDTLIADTCANPHALGFQIVFQRGTHFRVHFGEQAASAADGDINAQTRKHLSQFYPDHPATDHQQRSEEHTSELQSLMRISYAVFCLKKKTKLKDTHTYRT